MTVRWILLPVVSLDYWVRDRAGRPCRPSFVLRFYSAYFAILRARFFYSATLVASVPCPSPGHICVAAMPMNSRAGRRIGSWSSTLGITPKGIEGETGITPTSEEHRSDMSFYGPGPVGFLQTFHLVRGDTYLGRFGELTNLRNLRHSDDRSRDAGLLEEPC
jgi:hypothetical protein